MIPITNPQLQDKLSKQFKELIDFFNSLEAELEYPNCEGNADKERILLNAQNKLIMWGKI